MVCIAGAIVDVSNQPEKVLEAVNQAGVTITHILSTHKHWDHAGGNDKMKLLIPGAGQSYTHIHANIFRVKSTASAILSLGICFY